MSELTVESTKEEIQAYAEQVAREVEKERRGEPEQKSDAQITNEQAGIAKPVDYETLADDSSGDEAAQMGDETGNATEVPEWVTDDVKAEATAYGIGEAELADFASREEFDRALRLFDKTALDAGRKALAESDESPTRNEKGQFVKKEEPKAESESEETRDDGRYQIALSKDLYDDDLVDELTRMRDYYESRFEALEAHFVEASAKAEEQQFDNFVDSLGHADLFGKTGKESQKELERRRDLHVAVKAQMIGLEKLGRSAELSEQLIARVANMVFAEELSKKRLKQQTAKISKQSQLRQGGSPTKPLPPRDDPRDEADRLYKELSQS